MVWGTCLRCCCGSLQLKQISLSAALPRVSTAACSSSNTSNRGDNSRSTTNAAAGDPVDTCCSRNSNNTCSSSLSRWGGGSRDSKSGSSSSGSSSLSLMRKVRLPWELLLLRQGCRCCSAAAAARLVLPSSHSHLQLLQQQNGGGQQPWRQLQQQQLQQGGEMEREKQQEAGGETTLEQQEQQQQLGGLKLFDREKGEAAAADSQRKDKEKEEEEQQQNRARRSVKQLSSASGDSNFISLVFPTSPSLSFHTASFLTSFLLSSRFPFLFFSPRLSLPRPVSSYTPAALPPSFPLSPPPPRPSNVNLRCSPPTFSAASSPYLLHSQTALCAPAALISRVSLSTAAVAAAVRRRSTCRSSSSRSSIGSRSSNSRRSCSTSSTSDVPLRQQPPLSLRRALLPVATARLLARQQQQQRFVRQQWCSRSIFPPLQQQQLRSSRQYRSRLLPPTQQQQRSWMHLQQRMESPRNGQRQDNHFCPLSFTLPSLQQQQQVLQRPLQSWDGCVCTNGFVDGFLPGGGSMRMQVRWKKKRGKKERVTPTAEQEATKSKIPPVRLEDRLTAEPPATMARTLRREAARAVAGWKTKRMFNYRNKYRLRRLVGLTHDVDDEENERTRILGPGSSSNSNGDGSTRRSRRIVGRSFVTPLTRLQHQATLPRTPLHVRFNFPHTLSYDVWWGPPQVEEEPHHSACWVSFRIADLKLTERQEKRLIDILGEERVDEATGIACIEADLFPQRNQNAAYLGDILQQLMREVRKA